MGDLNVVELEDAALATLKLVLSRAGLRICNHCGGDGWYLIPANTRTQEECSECNGTGVELADDGLEKIRRLLGRYGLHVS